MKRLLLDEDLSPALPERLRLLGFEARHVQVLGLGGRADEQHFVTAERYDAFLTGDRHAQEDVREAAFRAARHRIRIIRLRRPRNRNFTPDLQAALFARHLPEIERQLANPDGARIMNVVQRGAVIELLMPADVDVWLSVRGLSALPPR